MFEYPQKRSSPGLAGKIHVRISAKKIIPGENWRSNDETSFNRYRKHQHAFLSEIINISASVGPSSEPLNR
jgi:hypothetical protein